MRIWATKSERKEQSYRKKTEKNNHWSITCNTQKGRENHSVCWNASGQSWLNSMKLAKENVKALLWKKCSIYRLWTVLNHQWSRKNCFNHCFTSWNSFHRLHIVVQAEEKRFSNIGALCEFDQNEGHVFSLFWWTRAQIHRKWSETTYLRDNQEKYLGYASRNSWNNFLKYVWRLAAEKNNSNNNENSDSSHFYWQILTVRIENLRSETASSAGKRTFSNCVYFKF